MNKETSKFIRKYGLTQKNLSSRILKQIFVDSGFRIILFNKFRNEPKIQKLINAYEANEQILTRKTFILVDNENKLLFIRQHIGEEELIHYLLHELGHVWLKHTYSLYDDDIQEREADEFAVHVKILLRQQKNLRNISIVCSMLILAVLIHVSQALPPSTPAMNTTVTPIINTTLTPTISAPPSVDTEFEAVYITTSGKKYHKPDCRYVKNKTNIKEISKSEAIRLEYEPCKICNP